MINVPSVDAVYKIFKQLNRIPRPSHHEDRVAHFLIRFAERLGLEYECDDQNNVVIRKPATPGHEGAEPIVLLNHMDMVCVAAEGVDFDPLHDTIKSVVEDGWMSACGTSLGADNGIGLSMALAILQDDTLVHGPLEVLTTTNEEDGMSGAEALSPEFVKGRRVINLDSEDYDSITVGAAGACIQKAGMRARRVPVPAGSQFVSLHISGGAGGHSGVDINKGRGNVALIMAKTLLELTSQGQSWYLSALSCGNAAASIPSSGVATIAIPDDTDLVAFKKLVTSTFVRTKKFCQKKDRDMKLRILKGKPTDKVIDMEDSLKMLDTLCTIPNGPLAMREDMPDVVQTSSNLGLVTLKDGFFDIVIHSRSFNDDELNDLSIHIENIFTQRDGAFKVLSFIPSWAENPDTPFMQTVDDTFRDVLGFTPRKVAMHFVLEAGYYVTKYPGIQIASIGPRIVEPHSPTERVELSTVEDIWRVTCHLLERLA